MMRAVRQLLPLGLLFWLLVASGCSEPDLKKSDFSYDTQPIAIYNSYWSVIPLPNNLLNPTLQYKMQALMGADMTGTEEVSTMGLPITTDEDVAIAAALGLPLEADNELTVDLKTGMNELDGFIPGYVIDIPLSQKIDPASIVPFDGTNADVANLFFLDAGNLTEVLANIDVDFNTLLSDPTQLADIITPVMPDTYYYIFNWRNDDGVPVYKLTIRNKGNPAMPKDMEAGHTYLVFMTGLTETGVKGENGTPIWPDSYYCLFNQEESFIREDGLAMLNIISEPETGTKEEKEAAVQAQVDQIEGARTLTNVGVKVWEGLMGLAQTGRMRDELAVSFHFSIATNPVAAFLSPLNFVMGNDTILPSPADQIGADGGITESAACGDATMTFTVSSALDPESLNSDTVKLFKVVEAGSDYPAVESTVACDESCTTVTITPNAALDPSSTYLVAVSENLLGANGRHTVDQSYFGLVRGTHDLLTDKVADDSVAFTEKLGSPFLDNRIDTLISQNILEGGIEDISDGGDFPVYNVTEDAVDSAGQKLLAILGHIQNIQDFYAPHVSYLVDELKFAESRAKLPMVWVFTTRDDFATCDADKK